MELRHEKSGKKRENFRRCSTLNSSLRLHGNCAFSADFLSNCFFFFFVSKKEKKYALLLSYIDFIVFFTVLQHANMHHFEKINLNFEYILEISEILTVIKCIPFERAV